MHPDHPAAHPVERLNEASFVALALTNPVNAELLQRLGGLGLPQCRLTAGCLFQAVWNRQAGRAPGWSVNDHDVFYFDGDDLSWEAEDRVIQAVQALTADLGVKVEVKNQARVHLWYRDRFQADYPQLTRTTDGIDRYLVACTCVGIDVRTRALYAPHGLDELQRGVLRMNPRLAQPAMFRDKARSYQQRWPWLSIAPAEGEGCP
ncbi:nucleotidyltransferase family protein [Hydrogenophaga sp. SL48]|uniref:nucleotidyltransferase family protein n=1 Tax=Hydrogenophaga sp. SL48 TaxID=2806347 RepID=UPI001F2031AE|nr:nucleotidyltransferase family protein [Hydrogenophaga sp. SL48]UJW83334.1 nucleotidyltransferase family protein [Hydrogenophaga sp. SL48]